MAKRTARFLEWDIFLKGFTLLELLIVIAIIGILSTIAAVSYSSVQKKTRDTRRVNDMRSIQGAFEQYYSANNNAYTCAPGTTYLPGGIPVDPKPSPYDQYVGACTGSTYTYCAKVENLIGNANSSNGAGMGSVSTGAYYCVRNLQ